MKITDYVTTKVGKIFPLPKTYLSLHQLNQLNMKSFSAKANAIFDEATEAYHLKNSVSAQMENPYEPDTIEYFLYEKNWIDV
ncbi:MAG TPA: hypothetical protein DIC46_15140, partial [Porphyromonadaceae bacterium]|nr:hypothetical protein [Porphyromonadaceae bacterium]HCM22068.1 hypothetical protein [Porphyromonadaceae bacterium]